MTLPVEMKWDEISFWPLTYYSTLVVLMNTTWDAIEPSLRYFMVAYAVKSEEHHRAHAAALMETTW